MKKTDTRDNTEIQRIKRDCYEPVYANKMNDLEEMDTFLENYNLPKLNQEEIENMNRQSTSMEIETIMKNLHQTKVQGLKSSQLNSNKSLVNNYQIF